MDCNQSSLDMTVEVHTSSDRAKERATPQKRGHLRPKHPRTTREPAGCAGLPLCEIDSGCTPVTACLGLCAECAHQVCVAYILHTCSSSATCTSAARTI